MSGYAYPASATAQSMLHRAMAIVYDADDTASFALHMTAVFGHPLEYGLEAGGA
jgi:hypothetical protein